MNKYQKLVQKETKSLLKFVKLCGFRTNYKLARRVVRDDLRRKGVYDRTK